MQKSSLLKRLWFVLIASRTHAIATALFGSLRPEKKVYMPGPYDTLLKSSG